MNNHRRNSINSCRSSISCSLESFNNNFDSSHRNESIESFSEYSSKGSLGGGYSYGDDVSSLSRIRGNHSDYTTYDDGISNFNDTIDDYEEENKDLFSNEGVTNAIPPARLQMNSINRRNDLRQNLKSFRFKSRRTSELVRHLSQASILSEEDDANVEMSKPLKRRLRDFRFAQKERAEKYGEKNPWGIIGLYEHLSGIRIDIEWAENAALRRDLGQPYLKWEDYNASKKTGLNKPFFTYFTILVCTITLIISFQINGWKIQPINENPMFGPSQDVLLKMGARQTYRIVTDKEWYRIVTAIFLHAGILHYVMNITGLWVIGHTIEKNHGSFVAALLFIIPGVGGNLLSGLFLPQAISVGASGANFGLIGACLADIFSNWGLLFSKHMKKNNQNRVCQNIIVLVILFLDVIANMCMGLTPYIDNFTHMGGIVFGFCCGLSTMKRLPKEFFGEEETFLEKIWNYLVKWFGLIFSITCISVGFWKLVSLSRNDDAKMIDCGWCTYVSCVPFPFWTDDPWWTCNERLS